MGLSDLKGLGSKSIDHILQVIRGTNTKSSLGFSGVRLQVDREERQELISTLWYGKESSVTEWTEVITPWSEDRFSLRPIIVWCDMNCKDGVRLSLYKKRTTWGEPVFHQARVRFKDKKLAVLFKLSIDI